ncbi:MAG: hypothetical protein ACN6PH_18350 [Pseudomonas sp.]
MTTGQAAYRLSINTCKEVGLKFKPFTSSAARIAVWQQDVTDEVSNIPATGTTVSLGVTCRRGVDMQITARLTPQWTVWGSHAIQQAKVRNAFTDDGRSLAGNEVISTPALHQQCRRRLPIQRRLALRPASAPARLQHRHAQRTGQVRRFRGTGFQRALPGFRDHPPRPATEEPDRSQV